MNATPTNLLTELAKVVATATTFILDPGQGQSRSLYIHHLPDTHQGWQRDAVLRMAGGAAKAHDPLDRLSVQIMVRAADQALAWDGAWSIYNAFVDSVGLPKRRVSLGDNWLALELDIAAPQSIGIDGSGRYLITMNLNLTAGQLA
ncbi:MAG: hypothetical protein IT430_09875 [Phycisphaerales bacterium]|nr:hypothetical protein [Phycisphaerales bacterium]